MSARPRIAVALLALLFFALGVAPSVHAQDFYWDTASARSMALGGTYVSSSSDAVGALAANPAGLTYLTHHNLNLDVAGVFARGSFSNSVNNDAPLQTSPGAIPYGAFGMPIGHSRFSFGVGVAPDLLSAGDWRYVDAPGAAGATYGMQQQKSAIMATRSTAGLGFIVNKKLSIGATFGVDYNTNTLQAPYIFQSQPVLQGLKTLLDLHTSGVGWNTGVGVLVQPVRKLEIGGAWKSRTVINSTGQATGDVGAQFAALGVNAPSQFQYSALVRNVLPQSALASIAWQAGSHWLVAFQTDWVNWQNSFVVLPVTLTQGTNATINSLVNSNSLQDGVPLHWKDQYSFHGGVEHRLTESTLIRFGYAHANDPVPSSTLTPLTAAIMSNQVSTGFAYQPGRSRFEVAYSFHPTATAHVQQSSLLSGEYNNSTVSAGTQTLMLGYSLKF
jgi:long-chain fatty acid transport protein